MQFLFSSHPEIEMGSSKDVFAWPLPFYHLYGISTVFGFIPCEGGTTAILPKFNLELYLKSIQQYKVGCEWTTPLHWNAFARKPSRTPLWFRQCEFVPVHAKVLFSRWRFSSSCHQLHCTWLAVRWWTSTMSPPWGSCGVEPPHWRKTCKANSSPGWKMFPSKEVLPIFIRVWWCQF